MDACPRCQNTRLRRNGKVGGRQRYHCSACGLSPSVTHKSDNLTPEERRLAADMRKEGLSYRKIGRLLRVHHASVLRALRRDSRARSPLPISIAGTTAVTSKTTPPAGTA